MTRKVFEYLIILVVFVLGVLLLALKQWNFVSVLTLVLPNLVAVLIAFLVMHYLFTRRDINVSEITGMQSVRTELRGHVVPAARRLEKAIQRANEALSMFYQSNDIDPLKMPAIMYQHQVMTSDIFEAYRILTEAWATIDTKTEMLDPLLKSKEFVAQALLHSQEVNEQIKQNNNNPDSTILTAFKVLQNDLSIAPELLNIPRR